MGTTSFNCMAQVHYEYYYKSIFFLQSYDFFLFYRMKEKLPFKAKVVFFVRQIKFNTTLSMVSHITLLTQLTYDNWMIIQ